MNLSRLEWKVGLFVLLALVLAGALIMKFSKATSVFTNTYELLLTTSNVGGIRSGASVLMAGVPVGIVKAVDLDENGRIVTMHVQIQSRYKIHRDARFTIEQAGFLGDPYIAITPTSNREPQLQPGEEVRCEEPFNLQEVARSAAGVLRRIDQTADRFNEAVGRIDQTLLSEQTLTNLSGAISNFGEASDQALVTLHSIDSLVESNSSSLNITMSNLVEFSEELDQLTAELRLAVATNRVELTSAIKSLKSGAARANDLIGDLQAGKGLMGSLLQDEQLRQQFAAAINHLEVVSSNMSTHGLLWKPPRQRTSSAPSIYTGKNPNR